MVPQISTLRKIFIQRNTRLLVNFWIFLGSKKCCFSSFSHTLTVDDRNVWVWWTVHINVSQVYSGKEDRESDSEKCWLLSRQTWETTGCYVSWVVINYKKLIPSANIPFRFSSGWVWPSTTQTLFHSSLACQEQRTIWLKKNYVPSRNGETINMI